MEEGTVCAFPPVCPAGLISRPGWRVLIVGGYWDYALLAGLFCFGSSEPSSYLLANIGGRLLKKP